MKERTYYRRQLTTPDGDLSMKIIGDPGETNWIDITPDSIPYIIQRMAREGVYNAPDEHIRATYTAILALTNNL
jgi:hypothetical protein